MECICRCCLIEHPNIYNIFLDGIMAKLLLCSNIKVSEDDDLPKIVCENCLRKIEDSYEFRQTCERSDAILREWINTLEESDCPSGEERKIEILTEVEQENKSEHECGENDLLNSTTCGVPSINEDNHLSDHYNISLLENSIVEKVEVEINIEKGDENEISKVENLKEPLINSKGEKILAISRTSDSIETEGSFGIRVTNAEYEKEVETNREPQQCTFKEDTRNCENSNLKKIKVETEDNLRRKGKLECGMVCTICNNKFPSKNALKKHQSTHAKNDNFSCDYCNKTFSRVLYLTRHLRRHSGFKRHECSVCNARFYDSSSLKVHSRIHTGEKPYECEQCNKRFVQRSQLNAHVRIHSDEKPFECDICYKRFSHTTLLQTHKKIHLPEKENVCHLCKKGFTLPAQLKVHMERHTEQEAKYQCNECGRTFFHKTALIYHMRTHSGERPYECIICSKSFLTKTHLCTHYRTHTKLKPPPKSKCPHCGKGCFSNSELRVHLRTHTGERPFECTICKKRFLLKVHLVVHMRTHTGEKPYPCSVCEKSFASLSTRKKHMFRHTGEKNFTCDICGKGFAQAGIRNTHRKAHFSKSKDNLDDPQVES